MSEVFDVTPAVEPSEAPRGIPNPVEYLVSAARSRQIVMLGDRRGVAEHLDVLAASIGPLHAAGVANLGWEFTNTRRQEDLDALTTAKTWNRRAAIELFVDLLGIGHGYEEYLSVIKAVWSHNSDRPADWPPFRLVALGLPTYVEDPELLEGRSAGETTLRNWWMGGQYRDVSAWHMTNTITAEVLRKGERCVIYCDAHRSNTNFVEWIDGIVSVGPGNLLHNWMGDGVARVLFHGSLDDQEALVRIEKLIAASPDPESSFGLDLGASTLGNVRLHGLSGSRGAVERSHDLGDVADGYLFVAPRSTWSRVSLIEDLLDPTTIEAAEAKYRALDPSDRPYALEQLEETRIMGWESIIDDWPQDPAVLEQSDPPKKGRFRRS